MDPEIVASSRNALQQGPTDSARQQQLQQAVPVFATTFRRNRACKRCQRLRVKCSFADPTSHMCLRCIKARQDECFVVDQPMKTRNGKHLGKVSKTNGAHNELSDQTAAAIAAAATGRTSIDRSDDERETEELVNARKEQRIAELQKLIRTSQLELKILGVPETPDIYSQPNCVITAIELGLITAREAEANFQIFLKNKTVYVSFDIDTDLQLTEYASREPLTALAMILSVRMNTRPERSDKALTFMHKVIGTKLLDPNKSSPDLIKALVLINIYSHVIPGCHPLMYLLLAANVATCAYQAHGWDQTVRSEADLETARMYLCASSGLISIAFTGGFTQFYDTLPIEPHLLEDVDHRGTAFDKIMVLRIRMFLLGRDCMKEINDADIGDEERIRAALERWTGQIASLRAAAFSASNTIKSSLSPLNAKIKPFDAWYATILIELNEEGLTRYLLGANLDDSLDTISITRFGSEIVQFGNLVIEIFVTACQVEPLITKHEYFRTLQALTSMCRLRLIYWMFDVGLDIDVETCFRKVEKAWDHLREKSSVAFTQRFMVERIERFMEFERATRQGTAKRIVPESTKRIIMRVIKNKVPQGCYKPFSLQAQLEQASHLLGFQFPPPPPPPLPEFPTPGASAGSPSSIQSMPHMASSFLTPSPTYLESGTPAETVPDASSNERSKTADGQYTIEMALKDLFMDLI